MLCGRRRCLWAIAFLLGLQANALSLVEPDAIWRWRKGDSEASVPDRAAWRQLAFDDSAWSEGRAPFYYGEPLAGTPLPDMRGAYTCIFLRRTFVIADPADLAALDLRVFSDDGFVAWINGRRVVRFNAPDGDPVFTATALQSFNEPLPTETYPILDFREVLVPGTNVLAIQAFNVSLSGSSDFVLEASLDGVVDESAPVVRSTVPAAGSRVADLSQILVVFSEPVSGVDASDLLIGGIAATNVTHFDGEQYVFEFAPRGPGEVRVDWTASTGIRDQSARANPFVGTGWTLIVDPNLPPPGLGISEFMADNDRTLNDEDGEASDWIEISNTSDQAVSLAGWWLTDRAEQPRLWRFPAVSVPARGFLVVYASGKNRTNATGPLHASFRLDRAGGYLALARPGGEVASEFVDYPPQFEDVSFGRLATDPLRTGYFPEPTPGSINREGGPGFAPEVRFSRIGGTFLEPFGLRLETAEPAATIRYTTDGSLPSETSAVYGAPLQIVGSSRVRARAYLAGLLPGPVSAEYYVALNASAVAVTSTLPLVVIHSFGRGAVPPNGEYPAFVAIHEPRDGVSSLTNAPDLRTRVKLNIRGSSTLGQPKRNYSVEFRDEREADRALEPLGMPAEADWILYAPNNFEPVLIHNPFAFQLSQSIGRYAPRTRFVEVYVQTASGPIGSAQYAGIYVMMEKIDRGRDRVAVDRLEPEHVRPPEVTGGYVLKIDRLDPGDSGLYAGGQVMGFVDPKEEEMSLPQRAAQRTYIREYLDQFANALYAAQWQDPIRGWRAYVEEASWIDHHLLNVLTFNVDALRLSAYFYKPRNGKLGFGPVWDFDRALNSTDGRDANPRVWRSQVSDRGTDFFNYPWWGRMFSDPDFWQAYIDRYQELRRGAFGTNQLFGLVDALATEVRPAQPSEAARWPGFTTPRVSYESEVAALKTWLGRRVQFMDTNFLAAPVPDVAPGKVESGTRIAWSGPPGATVYYTTDGTDPRAPGGGIATAARAYSGPIAVTGPTLIRSRSRNPNHRNLTGPDNPPISSPWSGLVDARYSTFPSATPGALVISELNYRPAPPTAAELAARPGLGRGDFAFVELLNRSSQALDLADLRFTRGITFHFRTSSIPVLAPGERLVLARNPQAFALRYGNQVPVAGAFESNLAGSGEALQIRNGQGEAVVTLEYRDDWYPATDGFGFTLVLRDESTSPGPATSRPSGWRPSSRPGGSPGAADPEPAAVPKVVINELLTHTDPPQLDGVELLNLEPVPADISGWFLSDDRSSPAKYRIPDGTVIPPGGHLWLDERAFAADPASPSYFRLDSTGDSAWVFAADRSGGLLGYAHGFAFGAVANGVSLGRWVTCDGDEVLVELETVTSGAANAPRRQPSVVISEVHYHPPDIQLGGAAINDTALEFVELFNRGAEPVSLFDPAHPTNTWRLRGDIEYRIPTNLVLPAGGIALVVNFNPDNNPQALVRFRQRLGVSTAVPLFGPFSGSLPNSSARLELSRPDAPQAPPAPDAGFVPYVLVDGVSYADRPPWTPLADGTGWSLQRVEFDGIGDQSRAWIAAVPTPGTLPPANLDSDGDRMPDGWEVRSCLDPHRPDDAMEDADGDLALNLHEFLAGTDPADPLDVLRWTGARPVGARLHLTFRAKAEVPYRVESRPELDRGEWRTEQIVGPMEVDQDVRIELDTPPAGESVYVRLTVDPAP